MHLNSKISISKTINFARLKCSELLVCQFFYWPEKNAVEEGKESDSIFCLEHAGGKFQGTFSSSLKSLFLYLVILIPSEILFLNLVVLIPLLILLQGSRLSGVCVSTSLNLVQCLPTLFLIKGWHGGKRIKKCFYAHTKKFQGTTSDFWSQELSQETFRTGNVGKQWQVTLPGISLA